MNQRINNLNKSEIPTDDKDFYIFKDYQVTTDTKVDVYFRDMEYHLIERIKKYKCVVGCVAWLTNEPILKALANLKFVSIVVQKEDFLRPDSNNGYGSGQKLRNLYSQIPRFDRFNLPGIPGDLSVCSNPFDIFPIRCAGIYQSDKRIVHPRMHHKFLVFCEQVPCCEDREQNLNPMDEDYNNPHWSYCPKEVWTGSFNFTANGTQSLENAVVISSKEVAWSYYQEWAQVLGISEPLDWDRPWVDPEWRIGT